jgi:hypothetical protein
MNLVNSIKKEEELRQESYKSILWQAIKFIKTNNTAFQVTVLASCVFAICLAFNNQLIPFTATYGYTLKDYVIIQVCMILGLLFAGWYVRHKTMFFWLYLGLFWL